MEEGPTVPLICYWNGELSNEDRYAQYVGGSRKASGVSKNIGFTQFKQKLQSMMKLSSDETDFKIKCGVYYDDNTLIAADVDDDDSLKYILGRSVPISPLRAYIIKDKAAFTSTNTQLEEALPPRDVDSHLGGINFAMDGGDNNGGWKENPIHHMDNLNEPLCPLTNDFSVGQEFQDADTFREALSDLAVRTKREYEPVKTTKAKLVMKCRDTDCKWRISAIRVRDSPTFKVKKYQNSHKCSACAGGADHRQATTKWIASKVKSDIKENPDMTLTEIITAVRNRFGVQISYNKAVKAKAKALEMVPNLFEEPYHLLPGLIKELDRQGWVTQLSCNKEKRFVYFFWAFRASIHAFRTHLRPILYIDTIPIRSGVLMSASSFDSDGGRLVIAFGIFEEENERWWEKFLNLLKEFICPEVLPLGIVTKFDSETTVVLVPKVFPKVDHRFPKFDFENVFLRNFKFSQDNLESDFCSAAESYGTEECDRYLERIKEKNKDAYEWLLTVGKSCWSVAYSGFDFKYNCLGLSGWLLWYDDRLLITDLIVRSRDIVGTDFLHRQRSGAKMTSRLTRWREDDLRMAIRDAGEDRWVFGAKHNEYQVFDKLESREFVVNLVNQTCSCGRFQVKGIPCKHAAAVILRSGNLDIYSFCQPWTTADAYHATYAGYTFEEAYDLIPGSIKELEGSGSCVTKLNCSEDGSFVYCFWAFRACIHAFRTHLRPELFIQTRPLRSRVLMSAHCVDGNEDELFVAFGIFEEENGWEIFLNQLKEVIVGEVDLGRPWVIVTEFDPETSKVLVPKVFPQVNHRLDLLDIPIIFFRDFADIEVVAISELMVRTTDIVARDFLRRQREGAQMTDKLITRCEGKLRQYIEYTQSYGISNGGTKDEYQVCDANREMYRVSLVNQTCTL